MASADIKVSESGLKVDEMQAGYHKKPKEIHMPPAFLLFEIAVLSWPIWGFVLGLAILIGGLVISMF